MDDLLFVIIVRDEIRVSLMEKHGTGVEFLDDLVGIGFLDDLSVALVQNVVAFVRQCSQADEPVRIGLGRHDERATGAQLPVCLELFDKWRVLRAEVLGVDGCSQREFIRRAAEVSTQDVLVAGVDRRRAKAA